LCRTTDATTVQVRDGEVLVADGPFAETKEQIGGYFLVAALLGPVAEADLAAGALLFPNPMGLVAPSANEP